MTKTIYYEEYLGDGVYVAFDGEHVVLKANSHDCPTDTIYLDAAVRKNLERYIKQLNLIIEEYRKENQ